MTIFKSAIKITVMTSLVLVAFGIGQSHGYDIGVTRMSENMGRALFQCVTVLGGRLQRIR